MQRGIILFLILIQSRQITGIICNIMTRCANYGATIGGILL